MRRRDIMILGVLVLLGKPAAVSSAEPPKPLSIQDAKGFGSPAEVWETWLHACNQEDWGRAYDCLTTAARDEAGFEAMSGLMMDIGKRPAEHVAAMAEGWRNRLGGRGTWQGW